MQDGVERPTSCGVAAAGQAQVSPLVVSAPLAPLRPRSARASFSLVHQVCAHNSTERARAGLPLGGTTKCPALSRMQPTVAVEIRGAARCGGRTPLSTLPVVFFSFWGRVSKVL